MSTQSRRGFGAGCVFFVQKHHFACRSVRLRWRDREDMANVAAYIPRIRASRFNPTIRKTGPETPILIDSDVLMWPAR